MRFRRNVEKISGAHFDDAPVGERRRGGAGQYESHMLDLAVGFSQTAPDVFGPAPPWLVSRAPNRHPSKAHHLEAAERHFTYFVGLLEPLQNHAYVLWAHG